MHLVGCFIRNSAYHNVHIDCTGIKLCLRGERSATISLSHGTCHNLLILRYSEDPDTILTF